MALCWWQELRCPLTGTSLQEMMAWFWSDADGELLYPLICGTPILMPSTDQFLLDEALTVARAMAQFGETAEVREWFFSRYGRFNAPDPSVIDSQVLGEGYPGFWESLDLPRMMAPLTAVTPAAQIMDWIGDRSFERALDVGCGQGGMTQRMAQKSEFVFGLEQHFYLAALANQLLPQAEIQIEFHDPQKGWCHRSIEKEPVHHGKVLCGSLLDPPLAEAAFDWVHCGHVLDLIDDPEYGLARLLPLLRPNAILTICSPWDFPHPGHFDGLMAVLDSLFDGCHQTHGHPWLRLQHKRRFILHEDWLWMGQLRPKPD